MNIVSFRQTADQCINSPRVSRSSLNAALNRFDTKHSHSSIDRNGMGSNWKDHLLLSGLPLEQSVIKELWEIYTEHYQVSQKALESEDSRFSNQLIEFNCPRPYPYERIDENGRIRTFSVDVRYCHSFPKSGLNVDSIIECKYRHPSKKWVFTQSIARVAYTANLVGNPFLTLVVPDDCWDANRNFIDRNVLCSEFQKYPCCNSAIEISDKDNNPKSIHQAIRQSTYGYLAWVHHLLNTFLSGGGGSFNWSSFENGPRIVIPIVVTTAPLLVLRKQTNLEEIYSASSLEDITTEHPVLLLETHPDHDQREFSEWMERHTWKEVDLTPEELSNIESELTVTLYKQPISSYYEKIKNNIPRYVMFINYYQFADSIKDVFRSCERASWRNAK